MKYYEVQRIESAIHEMQVRAKSARSSTGIQAEKHGDTSPQAQRYAWEACAYEDCINFMERAMRDLARHDEEQNAPK